MKIIYGITKSNFGGAQRYVFDLALAAKERDDDVAVLCGGEGSLVKRLRDHGIRVITLPHLKRDISLVDELRSFHFIFRTLYEEKPEVFHTNSSKMGGLGNLAARLAGVEKIVFTSHGWAFNEPRPFVQKLAIKLFVWLTVLLSTQTICVSERSRAQVSWPLIAGKLRVVRNGIAPFDLSPRRTGGFSVGTLAELHRVKGLDILLRAWSAFIHKHPQAKLVIMGEGEEEAHLRALAESLGIAPSVEWRGFVENARQYLKDFDIFVLPSRSENLPYALLEAGYAGLPVIATRVGGIPEIITTGENGILVEPENPHELLSSLLLLAEDGNLRARLGSAFRDRVAASFSAARMAAETFSQY